MTGPEHYAVADALIARSGEVGGEVREHILARAQVHATLAQVAATMDLVGANTNGVVTSGWSEVLA